MLYAAKVEDRHLGEQQLSLRWRPFYVPTFYTYLEQMPLFKIFETVLSPYRLRVLRA